MAQGGKIAAGEDSLKLGAQAVREAQANIKRNIGGVEAEMNHLRGVWTGAASVAFANMLTNWQEKTAKLNSALEGLASGLDKTAADQAASEQEHQSVIGNLSRLMS